MVKRRKWWFGLPAVAILGLAVLGMFTLQPIYRSSATILIESQDVPEDLVPALMGDYIDRRLDVLTRRVLLRDNLLELAERFELFPDRPEDMTPEELAELIRKEIGVHVLSTEVNDPRTGRTGDMTVAFELSFHYPDAETARRVVDELAASYMALNQRQRQQVIAETTDFFAGERAALEERITDLENEVKVFREENAELLPRAVEFKRVQLGNVEQRLQDLRSSLRSLEERKGFLQTQLALTDEFEIFPDYGTPGATPESKLEIARAELAAARARYSGEHPDVRRLEREVNSLQSVVGVRSGASALAAREAELAAELAQLQDRYTSEHPDVRRISGQLASVRESLRNSADGAGPVEQGTRPRNSAYVQLSAQLNSVTSEISAVEQQVAELEERRLDLQGQLSRAPLVEQEFEQLNRRLQSALEERDAVADKERTAGLSSSLEASAVGEQFVLAEPATVPRDPVRPNEKLILALGLVMAVGSGGAGIVMGELLDRSIRSTAHLARVLGEAPLVSIPTLVSPSDARKDRRWRWGLAVFGLALLVGLAVWIDRAVMPFPTAAEALGDMAEPWLGSVAWWRGGPAGS
jgi:uncharacterized protein involved in exopolysaccharide biosynthesis